MNATEHVNSIFGLHSIIKYNFQNSMTETFLPFRIKSFDLNLFYNLFVRKYMNWLGHYEFGCLTRNLGHPLKIIRNLIQAFAKIFNFIILQ